jgi:hypothetical protein
VAVCARSLASSWTRPAGRRLAGWCSGKETRDGVGEAREHVQAVEYIALVQGCHARDRSLVTRLPHLRPYRRGVPMPARAAPASPGGALAYLASAVWAGRMGLHLRKGR